MNIMIANHQDPIKRLIGAMASQFFNLFKPSKRFQMNIPTEVLLSNSIAQLSAWKWLKCDLIKALSKFTRLPDWSPQLIAWSRQNEPTIVSLDTVRLSPFPTRSECDRLSLMCVANLKAKWTSKAVNKFGAHWRAKEQHCDDFVKHFFNWKLLKWKAFAPKTDPIELCLCQRPAHRQAYGLARSAGNEWRRTCLSWCLSIRSTDTSRLANMSDKCYQLPNERRCFRFCSHFPRSALYYLTKQMLMMMQSPGLLFINCVYNYKRKICIWFPPAECDSDES